MSGYQKGKQLWAVISSVMLALTVQVVVHCFLKAYLYIPDSSVILETLHEERGEWSLPMEAQVALVDLTILEWLKCLNWGKSFPDHQHRWNLPEVRELLPAPTPPESIPQNLLLKLKGQLVFRCSQAWAEGIVQTLDTKHCSHFNPHLCSQDEVWERGKMEYSKQASYFQGVDGHLLLLLNICSELFMAKEVSGLKAYVIFWMSKLENAFPRS